MKRFVLAGAAWIIAVWAAVTVPGLNAAERTPVTKRTLVFSRSQMKYGLDDNYLRRWVDRPLFIDPALRVKEREYAMALPSYRRILKTVASYGLDGLAFFPETSGRMGAFEFTDELAVPGISLLPEFIATESLDSKREVLRAALACRSCVKIDGKILISSYRADSLKPDQWQELLDALREEFGDVLLFLPAISAPCGEGWNAWIDRFDSKQGISSADRERLRQYLRTYAVATDGLYLASVASIKKNRRLHHRFYREFLAPLFRDVVAEPDMSGKILGLSACVAHINCTRLGYTLSDDGTRTLRNSFEAALSVRPDVIIIPEWDEQNENTSLRPTVDNSFSSRRILRHYMQRTKGETPTPMPGDDTSLPNIVLSYRKILTLGEEVRFEMLNVPDSDSHQQYSVRLMLKDLGGDVVHRFPERTFSRDELYKITETIPSEALAAHNALVPVLEVLSDGDRRLVDRGWRPIQLRTTWNWDYKWVKQPLRDLALVQESKLAIEPANEVGLVVLSGRLSCQEPLASVEVIENGAVVYAVDLRPGALRQLTDHVMLAFEYRSQSRHAIEGHAQVLGSSCRWPASYKTPCYSWYLDGDVLRLKRYVDWQQNVAYLAIPKNDVAQASLQFQVGSLERTVPIREIVDRNLITYHDGRDMTVTVSHFLKQNDHPPHLDKREAAFRTLVKPDMVSSLFHVRAVTKSGRIFRSWPVRQEWLFGTPLVELPVWSETRNARTVVEVSSVRVPDIQYQLSDQHGAALVTAAGRPFWGILGGYTDSVTARGGGESNDGTPFIRPNQYPRGVACNAPQWCTEDGRTCLRFTGRGEHIALPQGVLPRRSGFHLKMDIKPLSTKPQILFAHRRHYPGSLTLGLDRGKLRGSFTTDQLRTYTFETDLTVPTGKWSTVEVIYNLTDMRLRVNGKEAGPFECQGVGLYDMTSVVGGFGSGEPVDEYDDTNGWFDGYLAALSVAHTPF
ncbi:MAG: hypothetical protein H8E44_23435 [Planctomycetes bacterium]|nr:hypothetical protein [Planctomycetota bacterium]MBL7042979.1 hypothetical protein [Pirellulaceae bacterium]